MTIFNFLFMSDSRFHTIYLYDNPKAYRDGIPAAAYDTAGDIPDFICMNDVLGYRIDFDAKHVHILY